MTLGGLSSRLWLLVMTSNVDLNQYLTEKSAFFGEMIVKYYQ